MKKSLFILFLIFIAIVSFSQSQKEIKLKNLGPNINSSSKTDCFPTFSADGKTLFFSRQMNGDKEYEIYFSTLDENNQWTEAKPIDELNNSKRNTIFYATPDGETLYLQGDYENNGSSQGISVTHNVLGTWTKPERIHFDDESNIKESNISITMSSDNQVMILCLPPNKNDLFVSFRKKDNLWTTPVSLPSNINTADYEFSPFLAPDNKTLYFSSGGHGGLGQNDIFKTTRLDDLWQKWTDPENVGEPINSSNWESFFTISAKGDKAIVYSLKEGNGDLFEVVLPEKMKPQPTLLLFGKVIDSKSGKPIEATIYFEDLSTGKQIGTAKTDSKTGYYKIILTSGKKYGIYSKAEGYIPVNENIDLMKIDKYTEQEKNLQMFPIEVGQTIRINNLFFDTGKSELKEESFPELSRLINIMQSNPKMTIKISGHTDDVGSDIDNLKLSKDRASSVKIYLVKNGIDEKRITSNGYGETKPQVKNDSDENRQKNRRVEFTIVSK